MISSRRESVLIVLLLSVYLAFAGSYSLAPIMEGPDERAHYEYIHVLARERHWPDATIYEKEFFQMPLYYLLMTPVLLAVDDDDFESVAARLNPYRFIHETTQWYQLGNDNKNVYLHLQAENYPYDDSGLARAAHLLRLVSVALGLGTLIISYRVFHLLWPDRPDRRLLALGLLVCWPQFVYATSVISNDPLLIFLGTLALWLALYWLRDGPSLRLAIVLGVVLGAVMLTKFSGIVIAGMVGLAMLLNRRAWRFIPVTFGLMALIASWWYWRNWQVYGEITGIDVMYRSWPGLRIPAGASLADRLDRLPFIYDTFWALLGTSTISVRQPLYTFYDILTVAGLAGLGIWIARRIVAYRRGSLDLDALFPKPRQLLLVAALTGGMLAATVSYSFQNWAGNQGRFLFPGVAAWAVLFVLGWDAWTPRRWRTPVAALTVILLAGAAAISSYDYFGAYHIPEVPDEIAYPVTYSFEGHAELIGAAPGSTRARPGDLITLKLYWRARQPTDHELLVYLHTVGANVIRRDTYPATGNRVSTDWQPGETWAEHHVIRIPDDAQTGQMLPLIAGLYDPDSNRTLEATGPDGQPVTPIVGRIAINGPPQKMAADYRFGNLFGLAGPTLAQDGDHPELCMQWQSLRETPVDYVLFVHVRDADGTVLAQYDEQPRSGQYPTGVWAKGEVVADCLALDDSALPESGWEVALGLYNLADFTRLPIRDASGRSLPDDMLILTPESETSP